MDVLVDASAILAVLLNEQGRSAITAQTENATLLAPETLPFEIANALTSLYRKKKITGEELAAAYRNYALIPLRSVKADPENALKIACKYKISAFEAYYLEIAYRLKISLITFSVSMKKAALNMKIKIPAKPAKGGKP